MSNPSLNFHVQSRHADFRIPTELIRKNIKPIQKLVEKQKKQLNEEIDRIKKNPQMSTRAKLELVQKLIRQVQAFQSKLKVPVAKDKDYRSRLVARIDNLKVLEECQVEPAEKDSLESEEKSTQSSTAETKPISDDKFLDLHNPKLINWYRDQTNLLIVDYLLKSSVSTPNLGVSLLSKFDPGLRKLIDAEVFENCNKVFLSIARDHDLSQVTGWFSDNRSSLKKLGSNLEFEINYCEFLSLIDKGDITEAINFSKVNLSPYGNVNNYSESEIQNHETNWSHLKEIGGLLVYMAIQNSSDASYTAGSAITARAALSSSLIMNSARFKEYEKSLSDERWENLSQSFLANFTKLYGISKSYPLLIYLSVGLSSLKTKSCYNNTENTIFRPQNHPVHHHDCDAILTDKRYRKPEHYYTLLNKNNNCPVCSPELFRLSQNLPYAQLITHIFENPFKLPNGNIYPFDKLLNPSEKYLSEKNTLLRMGKIKDPLTREIFLIDNCVRVYPA